jgi:hypothetical protein
VMGWTMAIGGSLLWATSLAILSIVTSSLCHAEPFTHFMGTGLSATSLTLGDLVDTTWRHLCTICLEKLVYLRPFSYMLFLVASMPCIT